jgi:3(or 17)beta-hydroxysteroid dehydrogenase
MSTRVAGKVALVTGGASGIGKACAATLAREGAKVVVVDRSGRGEEVAAAVGGRFVALDVTDEAGWQSLMEGVRETEGRLDVLVNAAGIGLLGDIERATLADFRLQYAVNVEGVFLACRAAIPLMKENGSGSIVNISSVAGLVGDGNLPGYCASKGAVRLLTKSIALHCAQAGYGIRCNSVHPSFIDTPMVEGLARGLGGDAQARNKLGRAAPLGRLGEADEVASLVLYLSSDESRFTTGAEHVIDGGLTAR